MFSLAAFYCSQSIKLQMDSSVVLVYFLLSVVGLGSFAFHSTLILYAQYLDALPMLFLATNSLQLTFHSSSRTQKVVIFLLLNALCLISCVVYIKLSSHVFHNILFGSVCLLSYFLATKILRELDKMKKKTKNMVELFTKRGKILCIVAILFWIADLYFCNILKEIRTYIVFPLDSVFQFHLWWHVLISIGAIYMINGIVLCIKLLHGIKMQGTVQYGFLPILCTVNK